MTNPTPERAFSREYVDFIHRFVKWQQGLETPSTDADRLIKIQEELGELAEAYSLFQGTNPRKGYDPAVYPMVKEAADVIMTAAVFIVGLGHGPNKALLEQMDKTIERFKELGQEA